MEQTSNYETNKHEGWIALFRSFLKWEWYDDINTSRLFIHILLKTNYKTKRWHGIVIERGTFLTSIRSLSNETKLSIQQVRTALDKLKLTNEVTQSSNNNYTVLQVVNYEKYQDVNTQDNTVSTQSQHSDNTVVTQSQHTSNTVVTHTNKDNKDNNVNKDNKGNKPSKERGKQDDGGVELTEVLGYFNQVRGTKRKSVRAWRSNYETWRKTYTVAEIKRAIDNISKHEFWNDKMDSLELLFRTRNKNGLCDYIGDLLEVTEVVGDSVSERKADALSERRADAFEKICVNKMGRIPGGKNAREFVKRSLELLHKHDDAGKTKKGCDWMRNDYRDNLKFFWTWFDNEYLKKGYKFDKMETVYYKVQLWTTERKAKRNADRTALDVRKQHEGGTSGTNNHL